MNFNEHKVLAVDDDPLNLSIIEEILSDNCQLKVVGNGEKALEVIGDFKPDIVLLDIMMPGIDGYEVCKKIRSNEELKFTKILMVSAKAMVADRLQGYQIGADDYITKPFNDDELLAKVSVYSKMKFIEELEELRKNTLKLISNNIKDPLVSMFGGSQSILDKSNIEPEALKYQMMQIQNNGRRLMEYCNKTMLLCELKNGKDLVVNDIALEDLVNDIIKQFKPQIDEKQLRVTFKSNYSKELKADKELLINALTLLLQNSIRYSIIQSKVTITCVEDNNKCLITIEDRGTALLQRIFNELSRTDINIERVGDGVAISIVEVIAKLHGGKLTFKRSDEGGVRFDLWI